MAEALGERNVGRREFDGSCGSAHRAVCRPFAQSAIGQPNRHCEYRVVYSLELLGRDGECACRSPVSMPKRGELRGLWVGYQHIVALGGGGYRVPLQLPTAERTGSATQANLLYLRGYGEWMRAGGYLPLGIGNPYQRLAGMGGIRRDLNERMLMETGVLCAVRVGLPPIVGEL